MVIPGSDGPGEAARFHLRHRGDRLHVTTDTPHPWQPRFCGPSGTAVQPAGTLETCLAYPA
ncbi:hypothetical protein [Streptomyces sp. KS 21]|uniref:hypothetical protein n=1 Tax=Streptomyces sp. KS 21 TaxID=2485150 RepID=UPI0010F1CF85|nr:hypothetical protein [Streptomyces sp. KS 21]TDU80518.1 hypothetical protein EDD91_7384 [Streptomyces sp. KS 21]